MIFIICLIWLINRIKTFSKAYASLKLTYMKQRAVFNISLHFCILDLNLTYFSSKSQIRMCFGSNEPFLVKIKQKLWILASTSKETKPNKHPVDHNQIFHKATQASAH